MKEYLKHKKEYQSLKKLWNILPKNVLLTIYKSLINRKYINHI